MRLICLSSTSVSAKSVLIVIEAFKPDELKTYSDLGISFFEVSSFGASSFGASSFGTMAFPTLIFRGFFIIAFNENNS